ncbi:MAG: hypothetical protein K9W44_14360 [Candidatus Lokiarchaeota archaeon]|nr:hypothetical protein [Candidatus Harpocratesius repetitus]
MSAKRFKHVKRAFSDLLLGKRPISDKYFFSQNPGTKPWPSSVHLHLVLTAHKSQSALEIRQKFLQNKISFDQAIEELEGFFTTLRPHKNQARWSRWLLKTYKKRWFEEISFRMLNEIHISYRNQKSTTQIAELYLHAYIFNC